MLEFEEEATLSGDEFFRPKTLALLTLKAKESTGISRRV
jgi:hypothetical protein